MRAPFNPDLKHMIYITYFILREQDHDRKGENEEDFYAQTETEEGESVFEILTFSALEKHEGNL